MVRYEILQGPIKIAYGYDDGCIGYFLSVEDDRLKWDSDASETVNQICEEVALDGGGSFFNLNTYRAGGFGFKVSKPVIFEFMKRYGIDPSTIQVD